MVIEWPAVNPDRPAFHLCSLLDFIARAKGVTMDAVMDYSGDH